MPPPTARLPAGPVATIITGRTPDRGLFTRVVSGQDVTLGNATERGQRHDG